MKFLTEDDKNIISNSGMFDAKWYSEEYLDVKLTGLDPLKHFLNYGIFLQRNPNKLFDSKFYLSTYPDVAKMQIPAFLHYLKYGIKERRESLEANPLEIIEIDTVDIVVPVYNALDDVKVCLQSLLIHQDGLMVKIIVVNDGSDQTTTEWLRKFCKFKSVFQLVEHETNKGYTVAVNTGLKLSTAQYVITQNSDTIVSKGWLQGMIQCMNSEPKIGIVGPLSNAASWQNVPELYAKEGGFAVNELPEGMTVDEMSFLIKSVSKRMRPKLPFVNGFCFMIKRELITKIGYMDEEHFPVGYGEENDFCIRAADAGFKLAIADDVYVFHAKSKSFGHSRRTELSKQGSLMLKKKHTESKFGALVEKVKDTSVLDIVRSNINQCLKSRSNIEYIDPLAMNVLFILPVNGGSGGANSVVQEVSQMRKLGVNAKIAILSRNHENWLNIYKDIPCVNDLFLPFNDSEIISLSEGFDIVIATIYNSVQIVKEIAEVHAHILPGYYIQDYEPLFFNSETDNWRIAFNSYSLIPNALLFAKTHWIANQVKIKHGLYVHKVSPSIDHDVYKPLQKINDGIVRISAMIRPQTPRRGAERTMNVFERLFGKYRKSVSFTIFGCDGDDERFLALNRNFEYINLGVVTRPQVAELLGKSDVFVDMSDYQAFGRTALEAMACGSTALVPKNGGTDEYAIDGVNALVVDTLNEDTCFAALSSLIEDKTKLSRLKTQSLLTASKYSVLNAAISEVALFASSISKHRKDNIKIQKKRLHILPSYSKKGEFGSLPTGSGFVRTVIPYTSLVVRRFWNIRVIESGVLPTPGSADVIILQRELGGFSLENLKTWYNEWRKAKGKIIFEIDDNLLDKEALLKRSYKGDVHELSEKIMWIASVADAVSVSATLLYDIFSKKNTNVHLITNYLDETIWRIGMQKLTGKNVVERKEGDPIRIGYIGTPSHDQDLAVVTEAVEILKQNYGDAIDFEIIGAFQHSEVLFGKRVGLPKRHDYLSFVDWLHKRVNWDIGIIPLADDEFNNAKSYLKFLEYSALRLPIVCSKHQVYAPVAKNNINAIVVNNTTVDWVEGVKQLIDNESLRRKIAENAYSDLLTHTIQYNKDKYLNLLNSI
ncbi:MAG: glycosyltransferase [Bacteroidales bacterium]|nr:glycosyltransferase [Bacteroidales bacterium]